MNKRNKAKAQADRELRRNGEGYLDLTAYEAIKRADAELEGKDNSKKKKTTKGMTYDIHPYEKGRGMTLKQYIKWKLKVLDELCVEMTEEEENYLRSLTSEAAIDAYVLVIVATHTINTGFIHKVISEFRQSFP